MNWYYVHEDRSVGPFTESEFAFLVSNGTILPDTHVWREGMANWQPYREVQAGAQPGAPAGVGSFCSVCGKSFAQDDMIRYENSWVCAACKPIFVQRLKEGAVPAAVMQYAGFWIRVGAKMIDGLILAVPMIIGLFLLIGTVAMSGRRSNPAGAETAAVAFQLLFQLGYFVLSGAYSIFFVGRYGATPGKMAVGIRIITPGGGKVSYGRACGRFFAELVSGMVCYIGYIMAGFDEEKRSLHDRMCDTRVVRK